MRLGRIATIIIRGGIAAIILALAACQGPIGRSVGPSTPSIGDLAAVTHETRLTLSGTKSVNTSIFIDGEEVVTRDALTTWAAVVALPLEGTNTFEIKALDDRGQISQPLRVPIVRDRTPPALTVDTVPPSTVTTNPVTLGGTKEAGSLVRLNGRVIVRASSATAWTYQATLATGANTLTVKAMDAAGNESAAPPVSVTLTTSCAAPRPVFPLDRRAVIWGLALDAFEWQAPSTLPSGGYRFQLSASPTFDTLVETRDLAGTSYTPTTAAPARGVYFWRVGAIDSACGVSYGVTRMVRIGATTGDINGDGTADLLVGVVGDDTAAKDAGAAYIYHGGVREVQPNVILTGENRLDAFGNAVAKVGDIDGDGYEDVLVGAYLFDRDQDRQDKVGRAYLFWGGPTPSTVPTLVFTGDNANDQFGISVTGVGDVNGDGYPDIAVGAYRATVTAACGGGTSLLPAVGRVYVYFGGPRSTMDAKADAVLTGETTLVGGECRQGDEFGGSVAGAGDVNGDGYDDLVVGARWHDFDPTFGENAGRAYVFYGGPWFVGVGADRADVILTGAASGDEFGESVAGAGDTDGDGFADLVIGAPLRDGTATNSGSAFLYFGGPGLPLTSTPLVRNGLAVDDNFGFSVASAGDVNRDGYADVVVGAFLDDAGTEDNGSATLYLDGGSRSGAPAATYTGEITNSGDQFGIAVSGAGDVNRDGYDDVIVGAYRNDVGGGITTGFDAGRAYLFPGASALADRGAGTGPNDWVITGPGPGDGLGISVR